MFTRLAHSLALVHFLAAALTQGFQLQFDLVRVEASSHGSSLDDFLHRRQAAPVSLVEGQAHTTSSGKVNLEELRTRAHASLALLRGTGMISADALADALKWISSWVGKGMQKDGFDGVLQPIVIIGQQHSGTDYLMSMLATHPNILTVKGDTIRFVEPNGTERSLDWALGHETHRVLGTQTTEPGATEQAKYLVMELQADRLSNISGGLGGTNAKFVFHWRRNVLRQLIETEGNGKVATMKVEDLDCSIASVLQNRSALVSMATQSGVHLCPISHHEDYLEPASRDQAEARLFRCVGIERSTIDDTLRHADISVLEPVKNDEEVRSALRGGRFEYMLEEHYAPSAIFSDLRQSDKYDEQPPAPAGCSWEV